VDLVWASERPLAPLHLLSVLAPVALGFADQGQRVIVVVLGVG
jgi:hypothetical protein